MSDQQKKMRELADRLNKASEAYYKENIEIMSNLEYDALYDELEALEKETGIVLSGSPTQKVGYETSEGLPKEEHPSRMLSLDKTKSIDELAAWLGDREGLLSWKLDGLTIVLTYEGGRLEKAVTRGNGVIGEVVTPNAKVFENLPLSIPFKGRLTVRGEAFIKYSDFERINKTIDDVEAKYKNPRNLCSGSVRQLNNEITAQRNVNFAAFSLTEATKEDGSEMDFDNSRENQMKFLKSQGFEIVEYVRLTGRQVPEEVKKFEENINSMDIPSDGLVLIYDDIEYGRSLGTTAKFPRDAIAFKWQDEIRETTLKSIEWSPSRTGLINPVAIFEPVELEGTTVSRASVHNVSILKELKLGTGDTIKVYKANMIIPQIEENITQSGPDPLPDACPVCGHRTQLKAEAGVETLHCVNPECPAKKIKSFALFVSRDAMNMENLSEATLEKFVSAGFVKTPADLFRLDRYKDQIVAMDGFGEKSYENLQESAEKARITTAAKLLYALGIPGIGAANAAVIASAADDDFERARNLTYDELVTIDGVGDVLAGAYIDYFSDGTNNEIVDDILSQVNFVKEDKGSDELGGKVFVITGSLNSFESRSQLKELIEKNGGKVTGSVSKNTDYLINNDSQSASAKNKTAKELGIPVITEEEFLQCWKLER